METSVKSLEKCKSVVTLTASREEWKDAIEKAYKKLEASVSIPGFRKGKVPAEIARSKISTDSLFNEAINAFLKENYSKALTDNKLNPIMQPSIEVTKITYEEFECSITVVGEPKVELGEYKGIKIEKDLVTVSDDEIEHELKHLQADNAEVVVKESGNVNKGDIATIDFEGFVDGVAFDGGKGENYDLEIGSNTFIPGFEDQLIGMGINESRDISVKFPENYVENLKGKDATFKVSIKSIKSKNYPEINDELAIDANIDGVNNLAELKDYYRKQITERKTKEVSDAAYGKLIDKVIENCKSIEFADEMVEDEVRHNKEQMEARLSQQGLNLDSYLSMISMSKEDYENRLKEDCVKNLKYIFTVLAVAKAENIAVKEEDFEKAYNDMANQYHMSVDDVKKALSKRVDALGHDLLVNKVSEYLRKENNI